MWIHFDLIATKWFHAKQESSKSSHLMCVRVCVCRVSTQPFAFIECVRCPVPAQPCSLIICNTFLFSMMCTITIDRERRLVTIIMLLQSDVSCDLWLDRVLITEKNYCGQKCMHDAMTSTTSHMCPETLRKIKSQKQIFWKQMIWTRNRIKTIESHVAFNGGYWIWMGFWVDRFQQRTHFEVESSITSLRRSIWRLCWK